MSNSIYQCVCKKVRLRRETVIVVCFVVRYFMSILVLQSS